MVVQESGWDQVSSPEWQCQRVDGVKKVQRNFDYLMLVPLLCKELRTKADLGLLGVLTNEEIRILIFILQFGNTISNGRLMQPGTITTQQEHFSSLSCPECQVFFNIQAPSFAFSANKVSHYWTSEIPSSSVYHFSICSNLRQTTFCHTQRVSFYFNYIIGFLVFLSPNVG